MAIQKTTKGLETFFSDIKNTQDANKRLKDRILENPEIALAYLETLTHEEVISCRALSTLRHTLRNVRDKEGNRIKILLRSR